MTREEFREWYYKQYPGFREWDDPNPRQYDLEGGTDLTRYRDLYLKLRHGILTGDYSVYDDPIFTQIRNLFFDMFPQHVFDNLHPRAKVAALYGYLLALEERDDELPGDESSRKEVQPPRDSEHHLDIRGIPSLDDEIPF